jgi:hypothetical protein
MCVRVGERGEKHTACNNMAVVYCMTLEAKMVDFLSYVVLTLVSISI